MDIGEPKREEVREPSRLVPGIRPKEAPVPQPEPVRVEPEKVPIEDVDLDWPPELRERVRGYFAHRQ